MSLQEENYQTLLNIFAQTIRSGQLESGLSSNSRKLANKTLHEIFDLFQIRVKILEIELQLKDLLNFSSLNIELKNIMNIYIHNYGDIILSTLLVNEDNNIIIPDEYNFLLDEKIIIKKLDYVWIGDENGN
jgi:hypothetical protein